MSNQVDIANFNEQMADAMMSDVDDELRNWASTQFGRHFAGTEAVPDDRLPNKCPICQRESDTVAKRRRNAAYADDRLNWLVSCATCFQEDYEGLQEQWDEYYSLVW